MADELPRRTPAVHFTPPTPSVERSQLHKQKSCEGCQRFRRGRIRNGAEGVYAKRPQLSVFAGNYGAIVSLLTSLHSLGL